MSDLPLIREAFGRALEASPRERPALLAALPARLQAEVLSLIEAHESAGFFLNPGDDGPLRPGDRLGAYRIGERIGQGGMGAVYHAHRDDGEFQREVAIKLVGGRLFAPEAERRFIAERRILARLDHPNIVRMIDGGLWQGQRYLVMELVAGKDLIRYSQDGNLRINDRLRLFLDLCGAIHYAHQRLVIHRDLKPGNILVTEAGQVKVLDFGIARLLDEAVPDDASITGLNPFTISCASPEQIRGEPLTLATDTYSLGLLLYELLSGRNPQSGGARTEIERRILSEEPEPPGKLTAGTSRDLDAIVLRALAKTPAERYASAESLASDVKRYLDGVPVAARPPAFLYRARKFAVRHAIPVAAMCALLLAIVAGAFSTLMEARRAERRFNEVRSLAHYFLFDVYDAIPSMPGGTAARRLVASRAQQYLDSLAGEARNDSALIQELAESYLRLGDVRGAPYTDNLGDTAGALESYRKAEALLRREAASHPRNPAVQDHLSHAYTGIGRVLTRQGVFGAAFDALREAISTAQSARSLDPGERSYAMTLSTAYGSLSEAQGSASGPDVPVGKLQEILSWSQRAIDVLEAAGPAPNDLWKTRNASAHMRIGYTLTALGDRTGDASYYRQALENQLKADAIMRSLAGTHPSRIDRREIADGLLNIAVSRLRCCGDGTGAMRDDAEAVEMLRRMAAADPQNVEVRRDLANAYESTGMVLTEIGRRREALEANRKAAAIFEDLEGMDPGNAENAGYLATVRARIAALESGK